MVMDRMSGVDLWEEGQPAASMHGTESWATVSETGDLGSLTGATTATAIAATGAMPAEPAAASSELFGRTISAAPSFSGDRIMSIPIAEPAVIRGATDATSGFALSAAVTARTGDTGGSPSMAISCACCGPMGMVGPGAVNAGEGLGLGGSAPSSAGTLTELANYLRSGYWAFNGSNFDWKWTQSNISFNVTALTTEEQGWAREAFKAVSRIANLTFTETSGAGDITFTSPDFGEPDYDSAFAYFNGFNGNITQAFVSISADWANWTAPEQYYNYYFQTYIHEIGHALGLGHQGPYNGSASYPTDAQYFNDSWQASVMSYFSQSANTYNSGLATGSFAYVSSYMQADILALQGKYGAPASTSGSWFGHAPTVAGNGFNTDANFGARSFTMYAADGRVRLDTSNATQAQTIRMDSGLFSSIYGFTDNVSQYNSTLVEFRGSSGIDDVTIATSTANPVVINGNNGNDIFRAVATNANHTIDGGQGTDSYLRTALTLGSNVSLRRGANNTWTVDATTGDGTLSNVETAQFSNFTVALRDDTRTDLTGDGSGDVLWYNASAGALNYWDIDGGGVSSWNFAGYVNPVWTARFSGDFQGDGRDDALYRRASDGAIGFLTNNGSSWSWQGAGVVSSSWDIVAVTDTNNDGRSDIIYRNASLGGAMGVLTMNGGSGTWSGAGFVNAAWTAAGHGDTDADGRGEVIFYNSSAGALGSYDVNGTWRSIGTSVAATWSVGGVGDFDGNGTHDVLMYNASLGGALGYWKMGYDGSAAWSSFSGVGAIGTDWAVEGTGDYNNDGATDILFYNSTVAAAGILTIGSAGATATWTGLGPVNNAWQVV